MRKTLKFLTAVLLAAVVIIGAGIAPLGNSYAADEEQPVATYDLVINFVANDTVVGGFTGTYAVGDVVTEAPIEYPAEIEYEDHKYIKDTEETSYGTEGMIWEAEENVEVTVPYTEELSEDPELNGDTAPIVGGNTGDDIGSPAEPPEKPPVVEAESVKKPEPVVESVTSSAPAPNTWIENVLKPIQEIKKDVKITVIGEEEVPLANLDLTNPDDHCILHWLFFLGTVILLVGFGRVNGKLSSRIKELAGQVRR